MINEDMTNYDEEGKYETSHEKTCLRVSDQVLHKLGCTATEDGLMFDISDLGSGGIVLSM